MFGANSLLLSDRSMRCRSRLRIVEERNDGRDLDAVSMWTPRPLRAGSHWRGGRQTHRKAEYRRLFRWTRLQDQHEHKTDIVTRVMPKPTLAW
jgi:hypothetical protein